FSVSLAGRVVAGSEADLKERLAALQLAEFIYEQPAVSDVEYIFKHALTHEVAYNSILAERRRAIHERLQLSSRSFSKSGSKTTPLNSPTTFSEAGTLRRRSAMRSQQQAKPSTEGPILRPAT